MASNQRRVEWRSAIGGGLVAALIVLAAPAIADVGDALLAGKVTTSDKRTTLDASVSPGPALRVVNSSSGGDGINVQVPKGSAPFTVNRSKKVKKLNADFIDGYDSSAFALADEPGVFAAGQIRTAGTIRNATDRVAGVTMPATGAYCISFTEGIAQDRLESAVVGLAGGAFQALFPRVVNGQAAATLCPSGTLHIEISDGSGTLTNGRFSFMVP